MALVHDDEIEEIGRELLVEPGAVFVLGDGLVGREIHLAALHHLAVLDLVAGLAEGDEGFVLGIVHEDIAVGEEEDLGVADGVAGAVPAGLPKFVAELEGDDCFAGAGRHGDEDAGPAAQDGIEGAVDGYLLVIPGRALGVGMVGDEELFLRGSGEWRGGLKTRPELGRRGEGIDRVFETGDEVEFDDAGAVGRVGEIQAEERGVVLGLLQAGAGDL